MHIPWGHQEEAGGEVHKEIAGGFQNRCRVEYANPSPTELPAARKQRPSHLYDTPSFPNLQCLDSL